MRGCWLVLGNEPRVTMRLHLHQIFPPLRVSCSTLSLREDEQHINRPL